MDKAEFKIKYTPGNYTDEEFEDLLFEFNTDLDKLLSEERKKAELGHIYYFEMWKTIEENQQALNEIFQQTPSYSDYLQAAIKFYQNKEHNE